MSAAESWVPTVARIVIPATPSRELSANARVHWAAKARAVKAYRQLAGYAALGQRGTIGGGVIFAGPVTVRITIAWEKGRKRLDGDNALAICKALVDGLQDAQLILSDRQCRFAPVEQTRDAAGVGYVAIEVEPAQEVRGW